MGSLGSVLAPANLLGAQNIEFEWDFLKSRRLRKGASHATHWSPYQWRNHLRTHQPLVLVGNGNRRGRRLRQAPPGAGAQVDAVEITGHRSRLEVHGAKILPVPKK